MALWCRDCPTVIPPWGEQPKSVCLVLPYYENPRFFAEQVALWRTLEPVVRQHVSVIVVDDGSPDPAAYPPHPPLDLRLFRIEVDIRWNWLAARNIGAHYATAEWLLLTDMDHMIPNETWRAILFSAHDPRVVYAFARREHTGAPIAPHSATFLLTRSVFWQIGGYDEALSGYYGTDGEFRRRVVQHAPIHLVPDVVVRHEYVADSSTQRYQRKQPEDYRVGVLVAARGPQWRPRVLSFPHHELPREGRR